jgi:hypothetical protein
MDINFRYLIVNATAMTAVEIVRNMHTGNPSDRRVLLSWNMASSSKELQELIAVITNYEVVRSIA